MCTPGQAGAPATAAEAIAAISAGLAYLNGPGAAGMSTQERADCLRELGRAEAMHTAARTAILAAFAAERGCAADGQCSPRSWLRWQTKITGAAAAGAMGWAKRIAAHPALGTALAAGSISPSWARKIGDWTDRLPEDKRGDADAILLQAAAGDVGLADLSALAEEMYSRSTPPDSDDDGFEDRAVRLATTFRGAGRLEGDLTSGCSAALAAVLGALAKKAGPEDVRTLAQRQHDALEEACRRLIAAGMVPGQAGQPTQIQLRMTLDQLRGMRGGTEAEDAYGNPAGPGDDCDAQIVPIVTGNVDPDVLDELAERLLRRGPGAASPADDAERARRARADRAVRQIILGRAADLLSGPAGLAAFLRRRTLAGAAASVSLPLDVGTATETIPASLRRAVIARDRYCAFPGCGRPPRVCQVHHIIPRSEGGVTRLTNLLLLCPFHHLIAIHRWGWQVTLNPDGTVTAVSPDSTRTLGAVA